MTDAHAALFAALLEYQKILNKEAREDRKIAREDQKLELKLKDEKIHLELRRIAEMRSEARERYELAMETAQLEASLGVASSKMPDRLAEYQTSLEKAAERMQHLINGQEQEIQDALKRTGKSASAAEAARDRRQKGLDNIQKLLDIIRGINPQI